MDKKMKVGTINYHRSQNYGALLVAYSLIAYLKKIGAEAHPIDYFPEHHTNMYPDPNKPYDDFVENYLCPMWRPDEEFDLVLYGADTLWNCYKGYGYDAVYWGSDQIKAEKKITYAISGYIKNFTEEADTLFKKNLNKFDAISVREDSMKKYIAGFTDQDITHTCDPTFLLDIDDYSQIMSERVVGQEYAIIYNRQLGRKLFEVAETVHKKTALDTYVLKGDGGLYDLRDNMIRKDIGPREFLSLIRYSSYVLAASFHAVAFSIIFRKQFHTIIKNGAERAESLLRTLDLEERRINHTDMIDMQNKINYAHVEDKLLEFTDYSKMWLKNNVRNEKEEIHEG